LTREIYGDQVGYVPWKRPGFQLGLDLQHICETHPQYEGVILGQHGLINWADDDKACYDLTLGLIEKAACYIAAHDKGEDTFGGRPVKDIYEYTDALNVFSPGDTVTVIVVRDGARVTLRITLGRRDG
jgi:rhamnose utilization protein RhaD (predicted bifunctional aldolase and dehydrogenase)